MNIGTTMFSQVMDFVPGDDGVISDQSEPDVVAEVEEVLHAIESSDYHAAPAAPLAEDLGDFFAEMRDFPLETMTLVRSVQHDLACNWKTYADNYLEGYHIPLLHPELNRQFDAKRYRVDTGDRYCRHTAPQRLQLLDVLGRPSLSYLPRFLRRFFRCHE